MNINETKKKKIESFMDKHMTGLIVGGFAVVSLAINWYMYTLGYSNGKIDQYNADGQTYAKQFNEALNVVDDVTKTKLIDTFNKAGLNLLKAE